MAISFMSVSIKGGGSSCVAAAAYRCGDVIRDERSNIEYDYTHKMEVVHSEICLPDHIQATHPEFEDRSTLWNEIEKFENSKHSNAQKAREFIIALPKEFSIEQMISTTREFAKELTNEGMIVDFSVHNKLDNPHSHLLCSMREISVDGDWMNKQKKVYKLDENGEKIPVIDKNTGEQKIGSGNRKLWQRETIEACPWNAPDKVEEWKYTWEGICNDELEKIDYDGNYLDFRPAEERGVIPQLHEGYWQRKIEADGGTSDVCQTNREIRALNAELSDIKQAIIDLGKDIFDYLKSIASDIKEWVMDRLFICTDFDAKLESQGILFDLSDVGISDWCALKGFIEDDSDYEIVECKENDFVDIENNTIYMKGGDDMDQQMNQTDYPEEQLDWLETTKKDEDSAVAVDDLDFWDDDDWDGIDGGL